MTAINTRIFKTVTVFLVLYEGVVSGLPLEVGEQSSKPTTSAPLGDHYDQRQNGTENYRIHVDGLVLVVAPVEALLLAGGIPGASTEPNLAALGQDGLLENSKPGSPGPTKPKPEVEDNSKRHSDPKSYRPSLRLANLIAPILRRIRQ
ncbi:uncharacterized protein LOC105698270 [Orussus abietinus]|uniref:uncharacterized protein LOC105698270 n=1 Tax=Orussus abietinus TaxID=222816 RepID=UPI000626CD35|nr:uncharacterized protein LOC105698270 [Orussus abietinus]